MDREILSQYADLLEEIKDLRRRIGQTEDRIRELTRKGSLVSDTVRGDAQGRDDRPDQDNRLSFQGLQPAETSA